MYLTIFLETMSSREDWRQEDFWKSNFFTLPHLSLCNLGTFAGTNVLN